MFKTGLLCVFIFGFVAFRQTGAFTMEQLEKTAKGVRNACISKSGTEEGLVEGLRSGQFPDDHNLQCYTLCCLKTMKTFKNGKVDVGMIVKQVRAMMPAEMQDRVAAAAESCENSEVVDDPCETAYKYVHCNYKADPDAFFFP